MPSRNPARLSYHRLPLPLTPTATRVTRYELEERTPPLDELLPLRRLRREVARAIPNPDPGLTPTPNPTPTPTSITPTPTPIPNQVARGVADKAVAAAFVNHDGDASARLTVTRARLTVTLAPGGTPALARRTLRSRVGDEF